MRNENTDVDELEVELCLELARMYEEEDLNSPPHRSTEKEEEEEE